MPVELQWGEGNLDWYVFFEHCVGIDLMEAWDSRLRSWVIFENRNDCSYATFLLETIMGELYATQGLS